MNFDKCLVVFSHGMESSPASTKIQVLSKIAEGRGAKTIAPDYTDSVELKVRLEMLREVLKNEDFESLILVGSSMGSLVSLIYSQTSDANIAGMFLMAPAVGIENIGFPEINVKNVKILHGWRDEIIPANVVIEYSSKINAQLTLVDDMHRLKDSHEIMKALFSAMLDEL